MLRFAIPALGISMAGPLMSNIDNAFVGRLSGTTALAAMNPGCVLADYILYLFVFLPRATVGLIARARPRGEEAVREELGRALSAALCVGVCLTAMYVFASPLLLRAMGVAPELIPEAASYARIRGIVAWAALSQQVALSGLLATRDSLTPLKVVATAALLNVTGDYLLCAWPLRLGVAGAAWATSVSTMLGFLLMIRALGKKGLLPSLKLPTYENLKPLLEYARPLAVVIGTRFLSLTLMAMTAGTLGTAVQASYQVEMNVLVLFGLFGEPLSQTAQTILPSLLDAGEAGAARAKRAISNLLRISFSVGLLVLGLPLSLSLYIYIYI